MTDKKVTPGEWTHEASMIIGYGVGGAVICKMAEPYPESGLAVFKPLSIASKGWQTQMDNAKLICTAVNACKRLNPDNPMAVAAQIEAAFKALEKSQEDISWMLNNRQFLNPEVFNYIEPVLDAIEEETSD